MQPPSQVSSPRPDERVPSGRLSAQVWQRDQVSDAQRQEMFALFERYYDHVDYPTFVRDMDAKDEVIILTDSGDGSIRGFCTLKLSRFESERDGRGYYTLFTGDTIVDRPYWGQTAFHQAFIWHWAKIALKTREPVYWLLITKGYKTYLIMGRNCPTHWPRYNAPTPPYIEERLRQASEAHFGVAYLAELGVVREGERQPRLKLGVAGVDEVVTMTEDMRFFERLNPHHAQGDQLVCFALMTPGLIPHMVARHSLKLAKKRLTRRLRL